MWDRIEVIGLFFLTLCFFNALYRRERGAGKGQTGVGGSGECSTRSDVSPVSQEKVSQLHFSCL